MTTLKRLQLDDDTFIYVEATDDSDPSEVKATAKQEYEGDEDEEEETTRSAKGISNFTNRVYQRFQDHQGQTMDNLIQRYTSYTLNAFKQVALAEVRKVNLEFGIKVDAQTGVPYVASGTAECSIKITVECTFTNSSNP
jgi:CRISPR/Cas system CMR subunit Cmr6 (Cas7 group RAMP superfamily)